MLRLVVRFVLGSVAALVLLIASYVFVFSASFHTPADRFVPAAGAAHVGPILVFGGNKGLGLEVVRALKAQGEEVAVAVRRTSDSAPLKALGVTVLVADALRPEDVRATFSANAFQAVISTLGSSRRGEVRPDYDGNRNVIDAARAAGVHRLVLVTVIGAGDSYEAAPLPSRGVLKEVIVLKTRAEDYLRASGLAYTIIRPGGLGTGRPHGQAYLTSDPQAFSYIARSDLASLVVAALDSPAAAGKTFSAYDPTRRTVWNGFHD